MCLALGVVATLLAAVGCQYDDTNIWNEMEQIKDRIETLEEAVIKTNEDIVALQTIVNALQKNVYVTSVEQSYEGYVIKFSDGTSATIANGQDGANGTNAPIISVKQDTDGNYYWTLDGEWLMVDDINVVTDWQKWDLSELGAVKKVRFNFLYSEEMGGRYGFTIPGYFAYDDVAVRFDK